MSRSGCSHACSKAFSFSAQLEKSFLRYLIDMLLRYVMNRGSENDVGYIDYVEINVPVYCLLFQLAVEDQKSSKSV